MGTFGGPYGDWLPQPSEETTASILGTVIQHLEEQGGYDQVIDEYLQPALLSIADGNCLYINEQDGMVDGEEVFDMLESAVEEIALPGFQEDLVEVARILADTLSNELEQAGAISDHYTSAEENYEIAIALLEAGKYKDAVDRLGDAWEEGKEALEEEFGIVTGIASVYGEPILPPDIDLDVIKTNAEYRNSVYSELAKLFDPVQIPEFADFQEMIETLNHMVEEWAEAVASPPLTGPLGIVLEAVGWFSDGWRLMLFQNTLIHAYGLEPSLANTPTLFLEMAEKCGQEQTIIDGTKSGTDSSKNLFEVWEEEMNRVGTLSQNVGRIKSGYATTEQVRELLDVVKEVTEADSDYIDSLVGE